MLEDTAPGVHKSPLICVAAAAAVGVRHHDEMWGKLTIMMRATKMLVCQT